MSLSRKRGSVSSEDLSEALRLSWIFQDRETQLEHVEQGIKESADSAVFIESCARHCDCEHDRTWEECYRSEPKAFPYVNNAAP